MINIYLHELKQYKISTAIWTVSIILVSVLFISIWPSLEGQAENFQKVLENFPAAFKEIMGLSGNVFATLESFFSMIFIYVLLVGAIQAMHLGVAIISKETRYQINEFLLAKPISRTKIITSKLLASLTLLIITNIIYIVSTFLIINYISDKQSMTKAMLMIMFTLFFIQLIFLALGFFVGVVMKKIKSVIAVSLPVVFVFYFLGMLEEVIGDKIVRYLTPFKYFDYEHIITNNSYEMSYIIVEIILIIIAVFTSFLIYNKKNVCL